MKNINVILVIIVLFTSSCSNKGISKTNIQKDVNKETREVRDISSIWILQKVNGSKIETGQIFLDIKLTDLSFSGKSFCNNIFGKIEMQDKTKIKFTNMGMTMMACQESLMEMETEYNTILRKVASYKIVNDNLSMYDYNGKLVLEYAYSATKVSTEEAGEVGAYFNEKTPLLRLYDIWGLKEMNGNKIDASKGMILELNTKEMTFNGNASCNNIFGTLESKSETEIKFLNVGATRKMCPEMNIESEYLKTLKEVKFYQLKGLRLLFLNQNAKVVLDFIKID